MTNQDSESKQDLSGLGDQMIYALHFLGGSGREFDEVARLLPPSIALTAIDLPGFGDAYEMTGFTVDAMSTYVAACIHALPSRPFYMLGHSMGAKVAAAIARKAEDGDEKLAGLRGMIQLAGSPPSPEPMDDRTRHGMQALFTGGPIEKRRDAQHYVNSNIGKPLPEPVFERAVDDVLRTRRAAWLAWLDSGSREDWADRVGVIQVPALIISGSEDKNLGPEAQHRLMAPHFANSLEVSLQGVGHLLPLEVPERLTTLIKAHIDKVQSDRGDVAQ